MLQRGTARAADTAVAPEHPLEHPLGLLSAWCHKGHHLFWFAVVGSDVPIVLPSILSSLRPKTSLPAQPGLSTHARAIPTEPPASLGGRSTPPLCPASKPHSPCLLPEVELAAGRGAEEGRGVQRRRHGAEVHGEGPRRGAHVGRQGPETGRGCVPRGLQRKEEAVRRQDTLLSPPRAPGGMGWFCQHHVSCSHPRQGYPGVTLLPSMPQIHQQCSNVPPSTRSHPVQGQQDRFVRL